MGLLVLIVVGAVLGWLGSIVTRTEDARGILMNAAIGDAGALFAGIATNSGSVLIGLSAWSLFAAFVGASVAVAALSLWRRRAVS